MSDADFMFLNIETLDADDVEVLDYSEEQTQEEFLVSEESLEPQTPEPQPKKRKRVKKPTKRDQELEVKLALCEEVRKYPCLYQITSKEYSNKIAKDTIWHKISVVLSTNFEKHITVLEVRKFWDALRESTRIYLDKSKIQKIGDKSGAPADLLDLYRSDGSQHFDIYQERWPLAEAMSFFLPSCARSAYTISIGDRSSTTMLKKTSEPEEECSFEEIESLPVATPNSRRSNKTGNAENHLDETLSSVASSLSKLVDARKSAADVTDLKFKEFHVELDKILRQMPFMQGMQFCMDMVKQANDALQNNNELI